MKKQKNMAIMVGIAILLSIISYFVLPDEVVIQINTKGEASRIVNKFVAIAISFGISLGGALYYRFTSGENNNDKKAYVIAAVGYLVAIVSMIINL